MTFHPAQEWISDGESDGLSCARSAIERNQQALDRRKLA